MSALKGTELGTAARLSSAVNVVADRSGRALRVFVGGGHQLGLRGIPTRAVRQPEYDGADPAGPQSVSAGPAYGGIGESAKSRGIPEESPDASPYDLAEAERALIIDDCTLFRENLATILAENGIAVVGTAWDLPSLVAAFDESNANVVLLNMATRDSHLLIRAAMDISPRARIIAVGTPEEDEQKIIASAEAGVVGYHMRSDSLDDLITLIRNVAHGESNFPPGVSAILLRRLSNLAAQPPSAGRGLVLTAREAQILKLLELGGSNSDIAARLDIAVHTVKNHVHNLLTKLGVSTRAEAAALSRALSSERAARKN